MRLRRTPELNTLGSMSGGQMRKRILYGIFFVLILSGPKIVLGCACCADAGVWGTVTYNTSNLTADLSKAQFDGKVYLPAPGSDGGSIHIPTEIGFRDGHLFFQLESEGIMG